MKLFESIMKNFDNDSLGLLGAVLGEHEVKVRDGVEAAVPEILCAIGSQVKSEEGRSMLWRELRDTDDSVASSFPSQLHYQNSLALVENGKQQLSGLIGQNIDAVTKRVSHAADIGSSSATKMVGAVSPLIFSSLAAWQKKENVDAEGWQKLFADQGEGLRERAVRASTRKFDEKTGQRTFPSFDKTIATGQGGGDDKWTASSGFTPGYTGSANEKFHASGLTSGSPNGNTSQTGKVAAGAAGAAAVVGAAAAGGKALGNAASDATSAGNGSYASRHESRKNRPAIAANPASNSFASDHGTTAAGSGALASSAKVEDNAERPRWVPDKENLKRERERTAIERARSEREAKLTRENSGGLGWLWWQLLLLAGLAGLGWFFRGEISEAFSGATTEATADLNLSEDLDAVLPSAAAAADEDEDLDTQTDETSTEESTTAQEATSTEATDDASTESDAVEGSLEKTALGENETPPLSAATETDSDSPADQQTDAPPMLAPTDEAGSDDTPEAGSPDDDSETVVPDSTADATGEDVDFQVETALTSLKSSIEDIEDAASAKSALPKMEESVTALEDLLKTSDDWEDVDKELIDIQLEEAAEVFGKLNKSVTSLPNVKSVVTPLFERLEKLLVPKQVAP